MFFLFIHSKFSDVAENEERVYEICGPLAMLIIELARSSGASLILKGKASQMEIIANIINEKIDLLLTPVVPKHFLIYTNKMKDFGLEFGHSSIIDYFEAGTVASLKRESSIPILILFKSFPINVWIAIWSTFLLLTMFAFIGKRNQITLHNFTNRIFNQFSILVSQPINGVTFIKSCDITILIWLMAALFLTKEYTTYLLDKLIRSTPSASIDSVEHLFLSDLKIVVKADNPLVSYAERVSPQTVEQMIFYDDYDTVVSSLASGLVNGTIAYVNNRMTLIFDLLRLQEQYSQNHLVSSIHLSRGSLGFEPYFVFINAESPEWLHLIINRV